MAAELQASLVQHKKQMEQLQQQCGQQQQQLQQQQQQLQQQHQQIAQLQQQLQKVGEHGAKNEAAVNEIGRMRKDLERAQQVSYHIPSPLKHCGRSDDFILFWCWCLPSQEAHKQSAEKEQAVAQVAKTQQEFRNACVERERLQSQLEMLVTELSNRQVPLIPIRIPLGSFIIFLSTSPRFIWI